MGSELPLVFEVIETMKKNVIENSKNEAEMNEKLETLENIKAEIIKGNKELVKKVLSNFENK